MDKELEDQFYEQVAREIKECNYQPASMARAVEKSAGNPDLAKSLYVKFRVEQLAHDFKQEIRRKQIEAEEHAIEERRQVAARVKAISEEKIRQKQCEKLRQKNEAAEVRAAQTAERAAERTAKRAAEQAALAKYDDSKIVCVILILLCVFGTFFLGSLVIRTLSDGSPGMSLLLLIMLIGVYTITYKHFKDRNERASNQSNDEPPD